MNFKDYLTEEERFECLKAGMLRKVASCGKTPSEVGLDGIMKSASFWNFLASKGPKALSVTAGAVSSATQNALALSLLLGVPIGAAMHYIDRSMKKDSKKTERLVATRDTYNTVMDAMKSRLLDEDDEEYV